MRKLSFKQCKIGMRVKNNIENSIYFLKFGTIIKIHQGTNRITVHWDDCFGLYDYMNLINHFLIVNTDSDLICKKVSK